ncbi:phosphatase PAP2 family protein [Streptomyces griseorubiginosus]|uniref:phosphatase PAP2 family protein n=1 Tax=Streptomyces griseorubiginosus TaxID=67304 RepID=UPI0036E1F7B1
MLGLPSEKGVQGVLLDHRGAIRLANGYYAWVHFPATGLFLLWLYCRRPAHYRWIRNVMTLLTGSALLLHLVAPLAPPRMLARAGMTDTAHVWGPAVYGDPRTDAAANQYAAMPSLHVGWAVVVAVALIVVSHGRWRWLWLAHPVLTVLVVVATATTTGWTALWPAYWSPARSGWSAALSANHTRRHDRSARPICGRERRSAGESSHRSWRPRPYVGGLCGDAAGPVDGERSARPPVRLCASLCAIPRGRDARTDSTGGRGSQIPVPVKRTAASARLRAGRSENLGTSPNAKDADGARASVAGAPRSPPALHRPTLGESPWPLPNIPPCMPPQAARRDPTPSCPSTHRPSWGAIGS